MSKAQSSKRPNSKLDLLNGPIASTTLKMSMPILISQILTFAYIMVDTLFISMIDKDSTEYLSGAGLVYPIYMIFFTIARGLYLGTSSLTARSIGEKNERSLQKLGHSGMLLAVIISAVTLIAGILFGSGLIRGLGGSELTSGTTHYGIVYFFSMLPCMVLMLLFNTFGGILQGEGQAKQFGLASAGSTILNIILNPILIFGFDLGVMGSGLASSISTALAVLYFAYLFARNKTTVPMRWRLFQGEGKQIKEILRIAIPASIGMFLINLSAIVLNRMTGNISEENMNAWVLVSRVDQLFMIPAYAIGLTTIPMIGQNFGRGNVVRSGKIFNVNLLICLGGSAVLGLFYALFAPQLFHAFTSVQEVIDISTRQVRWLVATTVALSGITVIGCSFQATGRPIPSLINNIIRSLITAFPLALPLIGFSVNSMNPIYVCVGLANVLTFVISLIWASIHFKHLARMSAGVPGTEAHPA